MGARRFVVAAVAAVAVLVVACGSSREQQAFNELKARCLGVAGSTLTNADIALSTGVVTKIICPTPPNVFVPIGGTCPDQTQDNPECQVFWYWQAYDPGLCSPQGGCCFVCEARVMKGSIPATAGDAPVCAARWLSGQPCI